jgi:hypothetical protein
MNELVFGIALLANQNPTPDYVSSFVASTSVSYHDPLTRLECQ